MSMRAVIILGLFLALLAFLLNILGRETESERLHSQDVARFDVIADFLTESYNIK